MNLKNCLFSSAIIFAFVTSLYAESQHVIICEDEAAAVQINEEVRKLHKRIDYIDAKDAKISDMASGSGVLYAVVVDENGQLYKTSTVWNK